QTSSFAGGYWLTTLRRHSGARAARAGIHTHDGGYGFSDVQLHIKARRFAAPRNDERRGRRAVSSDLPDVSIPLAKNILFSRSANRVYVWLIPLPSEGRFAIV